MKDGVLVDLSPLNVKFLGLPVNRMTGTVYADLKPQVEALSASYEGDFNAALAAMLRAKLRNAIMPQDIWHLPPDLWLLENEVSGFTIMYPSDY